MNTYKHAHTDSYSRIKTLPPIDMNKKIFNSSENVIQDNLDYIDLPKSYKKLNVSNIKSIITNQQDCFDQRQHPKYKFKKINKNNKDLSNLITDIKKVNRNIKMSLEDYHMNILLNLKEVICQDNLIKLNKKLKNIREINTYDINKLKQINRNQNDELIFPGVSLSFISNVYQKNLKNK